MKYVHRISISSSADVQQELAALGVHVSDRGPVTFEISEDDATWPSVRSFVATRNAVDLVSTKFTSRELLEPAWLELRSDWHHGYPQPNDDAFGYLDATYDLAQWCEACGVGKKQKAPFQMQGEPKWGKRSILQLNWVFDEYFVKPDVWRSIFAPYGVASREVLSSRGRVLETVVQLAITEEAPIDPGLHPFETCLTCNRVRYLPIARGRFPAISEKPKGNMVHTSQHFGSGHRANRAVLVSKQLASALVAAEVRGASLRPTET